MNAALLINQTSGEVEFYTPKNIVEAARLTMEFIDLDPASSEIANREIQAPHIYTKADDGLSCEWHGNVWMNHPFHAGEEVCDPSITGKPCKRKTCARRGFHCVERIPGNDEWIDKLVAEHGSGRVPEACCITFASTSEAWFRPLLKRPQCFLVPRTNYLLPDGTVYRGVTKGSVVTYFGPNVRRFALIFAHLGEVKIPWASAEAVSREV
jgi:hypothetical protein